MKDSPRQLLPASVFIYPPLITRGTIPCVSRRGWGGGDVVVFEKQRANLDSTCFERSEYIYLLAQVIDTAPNMRANEWRNRSG